jgi:hypothetical protein
MLITNTARHHLTPNPPVPSRPPFHLNRSPNLYSHALLPKQTHRFRTNSHSAPDTTNSQRHYSGQKKSQSRSNTSSLSHLPRLEILVQKPAMPYTMFIPAFYQSRFYTLPPNYTTSASSISLPTSCPLSHAIYTSAREWGWHAVRHPPLPPDE